MVNKNYNLLFYATLLYYTTTFPKYIQNELCTCSEVNYKKWHIFNEKFLRFLWFMALYFSFLYTLFLPNKLESLTKEKNFEDNKHFLFKRYYRMKIISFSFIWLEIMVINIFNNLDIKCITIYYCPLLRLIFRLFSIYYLPITNFMTTR